MIFILGDKVYNTETSEKVVECYRSCPVKLFSYTLYSKREMALYRTEKGNWFSVIKVDNDEYVGNRESEESVKKLLKELNKIDIYNKYFEELEEA